jgi:hypothetical protein
MPIVFPATILPQAAHSGVLGDCEQAATNHSHIVIDAGKPPVTLSLPEGNMQRDRQWPHG